ncbi:hypothetical protein J8J42_12945 [Chryseobacterium sp. cx-311]|uniref:hypothetical protein n=1 Tax=Marnyiella aurantia TaxID=2758037 RepID=UPI001AE762DA|nr:hypothetical protein [Marnyiella aurantia]MBP0613945.1 hypothetical protein [Marnyiella aurantia]
MNSKTKDAIQIILVILSILMLLYSIIYLVNYYSENDILTHFPSNKKSEDTDLLTPNEIGDSIGGVLNPIIGITGSILTFLAFYIQYKANKEQRKFFYIGLNNEKQNRIDESNKNIDLEKKHHITNLKIFKSLVSSMLNYYISSSQNIKDFLESEEAKPLGIHLFIFKTDSSYEYFNKLDFKNIYDSIVYSFQNKNEDWENDFIKILNILNFYEKLLAEMKNTYKIHSQSKAEKLNKVGESITQEIGYVLSDNELKNFDGIVEFLEIVYNSNPDNTPVLPEDQFKGTDFERLQDEFFNKYLEKLHMRYNETANEKYKSQLDKFSFMNKKIGVEKFQTVAYTKHLREVYENNFINQTNFDKVQEFLNKINIS